MAQSVEVTYPNLERARAGHRGHKSNVTRAIRLLDIVFSTVRNVSNLEHIPADILGDLSCHSKCCSDAMDSFQSSRVAIGIFHGDLADRDLGFLDGPMDTMEQVQILQTEARLALADKAQSVRNKLATVYPRCIIETLKPEKLLASATLFEFRAWCLSFEVYYSSNHMDLLPLTEQRGHLRCCIDLKLQQGLFVLTTQECTVMGPDGLLAELKKVFLANTPLLIRRCKLFFCNQYPGELFSDWYLRLQLESQEAELDEISADYLFVLRLVTGTSDQSLRDKFIRQEKPTRQSLVRIAQSRESAKKIDETISTNNHHINMEAVSSYKRNKHTQIHPSELDGLERKVLWLWRRF